MKNLKKTLAMISAVALAGSVFAACGETTTTDDGADTVAADNGDAAVADDAADADADDSYAADADADADADASTGSADGKLTVLCWNTDDINPMVECFVANTDHTADDFNIVSFGCAGEDAAENYNNYLSDASNDADIMFVEAGWALKYINDDSDATGTKPLSDIGFSDSDFSDIYDYVVEIGKSTSGVQKGISWQAAAGGFCYRTDLAEQYLGVTSNDEMQALVSDWTKFEETAAKVSEASNGETALTATMAGIYQVFSAARSDAWVVDNKLVLDDSCKEYISLAKNFYDNGYVIKDLAQWNADWYAAGQTDKTMGYFVSTWGFGDSILTQAAGYEDGATYGKWQCIEGPQNYYWGGTWLTVANRCDNTDLAKEFIEFFTTNADTAATYANFKGEYVSNKTAMESVISTFEGIGVLNGQNYFEVLNSCADSIDMSGAITPYDATIKVAFNDAVTGYCQGTYATEDEAIDAWVDKVAEQLPELDFSNFD